MANSIDRVEKFIIEAASSENLGQIEKISPEQRIWDEAIEQLQKGQERESLSRDELLRNCDRCLSRVEQQISQIQNQPEGKERELDRLRTLHSELHRLHRTLERGVDSQSKITLERQGDVETGSMRSLGVTAAWVIGMVGTILCLLYFPPLTILFVGVFFLGILMMGAESR